jgi:hypothetical protein
VPVCHCDPPDCPPIRLTPQDRLVLALDTRKLCEAIRAALRFQPATPGQFPGAARSLRLGTNGPAQSPVILSFPTEEGDILAEVGGLCAAIPGPIILLTPTARHHTPTVEAALRRHGCLHIPLAQFVSLASPGKLTASAAVKPILAAFDRSLAGPSPLRGEGGRRPDEVVRPKYSIHKGGDYWTITFDGQDAPKRHEKGLLYVAWLLTNPPKEPVHAMELLAKAPAIYRRQLGLTSAVDESTGKAVALDATSMPQERSHAADDLEVARRIHAKEREWEAVLDDEDASEAEKNEALQKLEELAAFQRRHAMRSKGNAEKLVRAVRVAITRLHANLAKATDEKGQPHPVLRPFADHLVKHLITPSARYNGRMGARTRAGVAGRFTYEPPPGVAWSG